MASNHDLDLYKKYKYHYNATENVRILGVKKPIFNKLGVSVESTIQYFKHYKFEGFYIISFDTDFLTELKDAMLYFGKDRKKLENNLFILCYHLYIGYPNYSYYNANKIIDEYCSVYDDFQKINFIERIDRMIIRTDMCCKLPTTDFKLSESEYKICEKFLLKQFALENVRKIEHYPKRGFLWRI